MRSLAVCGRAVAVVFALVLSGCSLFPDQPDETAGWSANKIYTEAKSMMSDGAYDKAIKYFEKLESRYPYGRYAQQAQLEVAYAYYRQNEVAPAIALSVSSLTIRMWTTPTTSRAWSTSMKISASSAMSAIKI
jgi:outer membrane protein assembly factor BamD